MTESFVRVVGKHNKDCCAAREAKSGAWATCWGPVAYGEHGEPIVVTKRKFGKNGLRFRRWIRYVCNDPRCKAELHIETGHIIKQLAPKF